MTLDDWLRRAGEGDDPDGALAEAEALCDRAWHARRVLAWLVEHRPEDRPRIRRLVTRTAALGLAEADVWPLREAAEAMALLLDDEAGAKALYEAAAARFEEAGGDASWGVLAAGAHALWPDGAAAKALLDRALARITDPSGQAHLASTAAETGDPERAAAILEAIETSGLDAHARWSVANAWHGLGRPDRSRALLDEGLAATGLAGRCTLLRAFASHGDEDGVARALAAADGAASTTGEWVAVADAATDAGLDETVVRERLERALAAAGSEADRTAVATAWVALLADPDAADAIAPRGFRPRDLRRPLRPLPDWTEDAAGLFDHLRVRVPDASLQRIAGADYGMDFDKHLAALRDLARTGRVPQRLPWEPHEVLALVRWTDGEQVDHLERAFACVTLLLGDADESVNTVGPLVESVLALGDPAHALAEGFAAWHHRTAAEHDAEAQVTALWALALLATARDPDDPRLRDLGRALAGTDTGEDGAVRAGRLAADVLRYAVQPEKWHALTARWLLPHRDRPAIASILEVLGIP